MGFDEKVRRLQDIKNAILELNKERTDLAKDLIAYCPIKIGDIVKNDRFSYVNPDKDMEVTRVSFDSFSMGFEILGRILKSDGTKGKRSGRTFIYLRNIEKKMEIDSILF